MQNRNKLITLMISNIVTAVVHQILEEAIGQEIHRKHYEKEFLNSFEIARLYREKLNPPQRPWPEAEQKEIKEEVIRRVKNELNVRMEKGYEGVDLSRIEPKVEEALAKLKIK